MEGQRTLLSVIVPTYNEAKNLPVLVENLAKVLEGIDYEIIIVDDNSPDRTYRVAEDLSQNFNIRLIRRFTARGLSSAVLTGMSAARGEVLAVMDADLQHDESILPQMVRAINEEGYDIAVGSREASGGSYGNWSRRRRFISLVAAGLARLVLPVQVRDPMSGFFAISHDCYRETEDNINPRGFKILLEFISRGRRKKIREIGFTFRNRLHGETKLSSTVIRNYLVALYDMRFGKYISVTFMLYGFVGTTGVLVNLVFFKLGDLLGFPHVYTGLSSYFDPLYTAVPFGYQMAIFSNYIMNNYITFYEQRRRGTGSFLAGLLIFELISLFGLLIHTSSFHLLQANGFLRGIFAEGTRALVNNGLSIIVALVSNYYLNLNFTWGTPKD